MQRRELETCIEHCLSCSEICLNMATSYCLEKGGRHADKHHLRLMLDCAEICRTTAEFMIRRSDLSPRVCAVCAEVCASCAQSCDELGDMESCVEVCRLCAEHCEQMAGIAA